MIIFSRFYFIISDNGQICLKKNNNPLPQEENGLNKIEEGISVDLTKWVIPMTPRIKSVTQSKFMNQTNHGWNNYRGWR